MKALLNCILITVFVTSCSKIDENNDPIIGIWKNTVKTATNSNKLVLDGEEWIFNDVYLGRFHGYNSGKVVFLTDFRWSVNNGTYTVSYPGTDFPNDFIHIQETEEGVLLLRSEGKIFAQRQN